MNRRTTLLAAIVPAVISFQAVAQEQVAQAAVETGVIMRGVTGTAAPGKPAAKGTQAPSALQVQTVRAPGAVPYEMAGPAEIGPAMNLTIGKSTLVRLPAPISRISVGNPAVADVTLIREGLNNSPTFGENRPSVQG